MPTFTKMEKKHQDRKNLSVESSFLALRHGLCNDGTFSNFNHQFKQMLYYDAPKKSSKSVVPLGKKL